MQIEILVAIISLGSAIIGALLSQLSNFLKYHQEMKKQLNESLFYLIDFKSSLERMIPIWKGIKGKETLDDIEEKLFLNLLNDEELRSNKYLERLELSIIELARLDPWTALKLKAALIYPKTFLTDNKSINRISQDFKKNVELQIKILNAFIELIDKYLGRILIKNSRLSWLKLIYHNRKEKKSNAVDWSSLFKN